jgi:hypothetical protein
MRTRRDKASALQRNAEGGTGGAARQMAFDFASADLRAEGGNESFKHFLVAECINDSSRRSNTRGAHIGASATASKKEGTEHTCRTPSFRARHHRLSVTRSQAPTPRLFPGCVKLSPRAMSLASHARRAVRDCRCD